MENGFLNLTWNNHGATYQQMLNNLRIENKLTDCTLACDGQKFSVHRLVLVTCSDFFKSLLEDVPCQHPIVYLRGVSGVEMQTLIEFMYLGKVDVPHKEVPNLLSTAETLKIKGLGVFHPEIKGDCNRSFPIKRKRSTTKKEVPYKATNKPTSSPLPKASNETNNLADKDQSPKAIKRDWTGNSSLDQNIVSRSYANGIYPNPNKYQSDSLSKQLGADSILTSIFKSNSLDSSSTSIISKSSEVILTNINENSASYADPLIDSSSQNSPEETITLTQLMPLNSVTKEHAKTLISFHETTDGHALDVKINGASSEADDKINTSENYGNESVKPAIIKEEALDYTRGPHLEMVENLPSQSSNCRNEPRTNSTNLANDDASQFFNHLARNPSPRYTYSQDENVENGSESSRPFLCPICRKSFAKVAILKRHHLAHFRPYNCHLCSRSFTRREVLAEHVLEHNGADLRLPCPVCKMTIKRKRNLQAHIKVKHPEYHKLKSANNEALC